VRIPAYDSAIRFQFLEKGALSLVPLEQSNTGLLFERYFNQYQRHWTVDATGKHSFLNSLTAGSSKRPCGSEVELQRATARQYALVESQRGISRWLSCNWRFVTGLGIPHPVENALLWHSTLAIPYLPGSAVKGLVRAALEARLDKDQLYFLFGSDHKKTTDQHEERPLKSGALIFMDALPIKPAELQLDVITNHMGKWYEQGDNAEKVKKTDVIPADWQSPNPNPYLTVSGLSLQFSIMPRSLYHNSSGIESWVALAMDALVWALQHEGAGAKTRTGFGGFSAPGKEESVHQEMVKRHWQNIVSKSVTTGAIQEALEVTGDLVAALVANPTGTMKGRVRKNFRALLKLESSWSKSEIFLCQSYLNACEDVLASYSEHKKLRVTMNSLDTAP